MNIFTKHYQIDINKFRYFYFYVENLKPSPGITGKVYNILNVLWSSTETVLPIPDLRTEFRVLCSWTALNSCYVMLCCNSEKCVRACLHT